jgi:hypothetical protein
LNNVVKSFHSLFVHAWGVYMFIHLSGKGVV